VPATYEPLSGLDKDVVRLLCGDRDMTRPKLLDEEIYLLLREEPNAYYAAARACDVIAAKSGGLVQKEVGDLRLQWGDTPETAYSRYAQYLREEGARRLSPNSHYFRMLGVPTYNR
jgi:hypothetical protein